MSAASAIAGHGPAKQWTFSDTGEPDVYTPDIPNRIDDDHVHAGEAGDDEWMTQPPCPGDTVARYYPLAGYPYDFRGPRGAYKPNLGDPEGFNLPSPETIPRSALPFPLFAGPFTIIWMAGNMQGHIHRDGEGGFAPDYSPDEWGPALWYGSAAAYPGLEAPTGGWLGLGRMDYDLDNNATNVGAYFGYGAYPTDVDGPSDDRYSPYGTCMALATATTGNNWPSTNAKGIHAFVYDPSEPDLGYLWSDGAIQRLAIVNPKCRAITLPALAAYPDPQLLFGTGMSPLGLGYTRTLYDDEGIATGEDSIYPWRTGYGLLHNVAVFDRAMPYGELRDLFAEINGQPPDDNSCSPWQGGGVVAILDVTPLTGNRYRVQGNRSYHSEGGTIARYDWFAAGTWEGGSAGPDPIYGDPGPIGYPWIGDGPALEVDIPWIDGSGNAVDIILRVTDDFGMHGSMTVTIHPVPPAAPGDRYWSIGRVRL